MRLPSEQTGGQGSVIEITVAAGWPGPPLYVHDFDEAFYVLEGELTFQVEQDMLTKIPIDDCAMDATRVGQRDGAICAGLR